MSDLFFGAVGRGLAVFSMLAVVSPALAGHDDCGQPISTGSKPTAGDCLFILKAGVGIAACSPCICDTTGNGTVAASDALRCLRVAVGNPGFALECNCAATTTTSTTITTTTTTTTLPRQCVDISGTWTGTGSGKGCCKIDGDSFCTPEVADFGTVDISQSRCNAFFTVEDQQFDISLDFAGPVTFSSFNWTGDWFPDDLGLDCSPNYVTGKGVINSAGNRIDSKYTAAVKCSSAEHDVSCTASGTQKWTR